MAPRVHVPGAEQARRPPCTRFPGGFLPRLLLILLPALVPGVAPTGITAQTVVGTIVEAESGLPLVTAVLTLTSANGEIVDRTLSDPQGQFTLRAPAPGRYMVQAERIGRGTVLRGPLEVADGEVIRIELRSAVRAISLAGIEVRADQQCRMDPGEETGGELARVWEQARLALQVEALTRGERTFRYQLANYTRELAPDARRVVAQQTRRAEGYLDAPYVSAPVEELLARGWVQEDPEHGGWTFFAPDAQTLLSEPFQRAHCFRLVADEADAALVGLAFEPLRRSGMPGIEGALWLDRESAALRHLTFRYTGFPGVSTAASAISVQARSGRVDFLQLPGGLWVVHRWHIRMPVLSEVRGPRGTRTILDGILEEGGDVTEVRRADGALVARLGRGAVEGTVVNGRTGAPLGGARVQLQGTGYEAHTGPRGHFRMEGLRAGTYLLALEPNPEGPFLGAPDPLQVVVEEGAPTRVELRTPPEATAVAEFCALDPGEPGPLSMDPDPADPGMVEGRVTWADPRGAAASLEVALEARTTTLLGGWAMGRLVFETREARTTTTSRGWYGLCARPTGSWDTVRSDTFRLTVRGAEGRELYQGFVVPAPFRIVTRDVVVR